MAYPIKNANGIIEAKEPTVGKWYCGFSIDDAFRAETGYDRGGEIAEYVGEDQFYDEDAENETDMAAYDYLVQQS